jgi:anti-sigma regulatory factor (Ser/Thr protein kinase)
MDGYPRDMTVRERRFIGGRGAPSDARHALREALGADVSERTLVDAELLVSELATNSVRHAGCDEATELAMEARVRGDRVHVRVYDEGGGFQATPPAKPDLETAGGYGLVLLDRLARAWGVVRGERFCVWFELERR